MRKKKKNLEKKKKIGGGKAPPNPPLLLKFATFNMIHKYKGQRPTRRQEIAVSTVKIFTLLPSKLRPRNYFQPRFEAGLAVGKVVLPVSETGVVQYSLREQL